MASNDASSKPEFNTPFNDNDSYDSDIAPEVDDDHARASEPTRDNTESVNNQQASHAARTQPSTAPLETNPTATDAQAQDLIQNAPTSDRSRSHDGESTLAEKDEKIPPPATQRKRSVHPRHPSLYPKDDLESGQPKKVTCWTNFRIMLTTFPYWNMAFWSGFTYTIGSAFFVVDGAWTWVPVAWPETEFEGESEYGVPLWFFFGACFFQVGGVMAYLEAVNDGSFAGAAMKRLLKGHQDLEKELLDAKLHVFFGHLMPFHHHDDEETEKQAEGEEVDAETRWRNTLTGSDSRPEDVYDEAKERVERRGGADLGPTEEGEVRDYVEWRWWPTWHTFVHYHIKELGYLACAIQLFGVTLFGVTSIIVLPGILDTFTWPQELGAYWVLQIIASLCFLIASIMFTVMAQPNWYTIKPKAVSWWIGVHAIIGSVGFLLCAVFGIVAHYYTWGEYQSSLSSMWGSFFYMLGAMCQWYEAIDTNVGPVLAFPNNRTPVLLRS